MLKQYKALPEMVIDVSKNYTATFNASRGEIVCELYPNTAPASIVRLQQSNPYEGCQW
jgi:hypothetical protein